MAKFMSTHTMPAGTLKREQVNQIAQAAQDDPVVRPYRSFLNLSEGKIVCVMEAPSKETLAAWFEKMHMPCDDITPVELEGEKGVEAVSKPLDANLRQGRTYVNLAGESCERSRHGQERTHGGTVAKDRAVAAQAQEKPQGRTPAGRQPGLPGGHSLGPA